MIDMSIENEIKHSKQQGFSLVELLIALALSSILLVGLFQIFNSNRQAFSMQDGVARVQESGRIGMEFMTRELRTAGYMGCAGGTTGTFSNKVDASKYDEATMQAAITAFNGNNGITGFEEVTDTTGTALADAGVVVGTAVGQMISGTDAVILQGVEACVGGNVTAAATNAANIQIENSATCGLQQGDIVVVANCETSEAFGISSNPPSTNTLAHAMNWNTDNKLDGSYDQDSYIFKPKFTVFYLGNGTSGEPALYMQSLEHAGAATAYGAFEVSEGIEDMDIVFGEDTDGDGNVNRYVAANSVTNWNAILAVRPTLVARSQLRATTTGDTRMRVNYETTIAIRNRVN